MWNWNHIKYYFFIYTYYTYLYNTYTYFVFTIQKIKKKKKCNNNNFWIYNFKFTTYWREAAFWWLTNLFYMNWVIYYYTLRCIMGYDFWTHFKVQAGVSRFQVHLYNWNMHLHTMKQRVFVNGNSKEVL